MIKLMNQNDVQPAKDAIGISYTEKWIYTRETVGMVCPTCGRDYAKEDMKENMKEK